MKCFCKALPFLYIQSWCSETPIKYWLREHCPLKMSPPSFLSTYHDEKIKVKIVAQVNYKTNKQNQLYQTKDITVILKTFLSLKVFCCLLPPFFFLSPCLFFIHANYLSVSGVQWEVNPLS